MQMVAICETFGWTYDDYLNQPQPFIDLIKEKMKIDSQRAENQIKNIKNKKK